MLTFSIFIFFLKIDPYFLEQVFSVSSYSSALIFTRNKRKEWFISFKAQNIGVNFIFLKLLVLQKHWQVNKGQVSIVAQYILVTADH